MKRRDQEQGRPADQREARAMAALLVGGAAATWIVAVLLMRVLLPLLVAHPALAGEAADVTLMVGIFALAGALAGVAVLVGLAVSWFAPDRVAGRVLLLVAGLFAIVDGLLLANIGTFDVDWDGAASLVGLVLAAVIAAAGGLACIASLSNRLPGRSLADRMIHAGAGSPAAPVRERMLPMLPLTAAVAMGWVVATGAVLARGNLVLPGFLAAQWGIPILAGAVVAGWRERASNHLETLGLAAAAGAAMDLLFLLALKLGQYYHNLDGTPYTPPSYVVWWGLMGALFGALGYSLWGPLTRLGRLAQRGPHLHLRPR